VLLLLRPDLDPADGSPRVTSQYTSQYENRGATDLINMLQKPRDESDAEVLPGVECEDQPQVVMGRRLGHYHFLIKEVTRDGIGLAIR